MVVHASLKGKGRSSGVQGKPQIHSKGPGSKRKSYYTVQTLGLNQAGTDLKALYLRACSQILVEKNQQCHQL